MIKCQLELHCEIYSNSNSNSLLMKTTCWRASKVQTINTQQINSTQSIKYNTDKLNKAKITNCLQWNRLL